MPLYFNNGPRFTLTNKSATNNVPAATCCMWIYPVIPTGSDIYLDFTIGTGTSSRFELLNNGTLWQLGGRALDSDSFSSIQTPTFMNYLNNWHFTVARIDFSNAYAYVDTFDIPNGHLSTSGSMTNMTAGNTSATNSVAATIGAQDGNPINGYLDDICFYNRLLSAPEIEDMYYKQKEPSEYGLVHRWRLKEKHPTSSAVTLIDSGSIGTATTITGGTLTYVEGILP